MFTGKGFTLIEVLITAFVLAAVTVAVSSLGLLVTRGAIESERKTVAQGIAGEEMEMARTYGYGGLDYTDASPPGKIERSKVVDRNDQGYTVESFVQYIDDPLTQKTQDFKQLTVKVSWPRAAAPVVRASFFVDIAQKNGACIPGTITCPNPSGPPAPFLECPASGSCSGVVPPEDETNLLLPHPTFSPATPTLTSRPTPDNGRPPAWCKLLITAPAIDVICAGELVEECPATCPAWRRVGKLEKIPTACTEELYCAVTQWRWERCPCNGD